MPDTLINNTTITCTVMHYHSLVCSFSLQQYSIIIMNTLYALSSARVSSKVEIVWATIRRISIIYFDVPLFRYRCMCLDVYCSKSIISK